MAMKLVSSVIQDPLADWVESLYVHLDLKRIEKWLRPLLGFDGYFSSFFISFHNINITYALLWRIKLILYFHQFSLLQNYLQLEKLPKYLESQTFPESHSPGGQPMIEELMKMCWQVYGYRMSLWAEHVGMIDESFKEPQTLDCLKNVNKIAEENWNKYTSAEYTPLQGHLLKYPIQVDADGKVRPLPGNEAFPDFGGKVLGTRTTLPDALTT